MYIKQNKQKKSNKSKNKKVMHINIIMTMEKWETKFFLVFRFCCYYYYYYCMCTNIELITSAAAAKMGKKIAGHHPDTLRK